MKIDLDSLVSPDNEYEYDSGPNSFKIGDIVYVNGDGDNRGKIAFIGKAHFATGELIGVNLDNPLGYHDGSFRGRRYFQCAPHHGIFARSCYISKHPLIPATNNAVKCGLYRSDVHDIPRWRSYREGSPAPSSNGSGSCRRSRSSSPTPSSRSMNSHSLRSASPNPYLSRRRADHPHVGDRVIVGSSFGDAKTGVLRYVGPVEFARGTWAGVELDGPWGRNDGTILGREYFSCKHPYGIFVPCRKVVTSPVNYMPQTWPWYKMGKEINSSSNTTAVARVFTDTPNTKFNDDFY